MGLVFGMVVPPQSQGHHSMRMAYSIYSDLSDWYRLLDPPEDHAIEAEQYAGVLRSHADGEVKTLLELGSGAGHNALYLKQWFDCTLTDISESMLDLSRQINTACRHHRGDMRDLRLGRQFDAVLAHDSVMYMKTEGELRQAISTAFAHLRSGGVALFVPDYFAEGFRESTTLHECVRGGMSMKCVEWSWDPDPDDDTFLTEFCFLIRESETVRCVHETHHEGMFRVDRWIAIMRECGFDTVSQVSRTLEEDAQDAYTDCMLVSKKP